MLSLLMIFLSQEVIDEDKEDNKAAHASAV